MEDYDVWFEEPNELGERRYSLAPEGTCGIGYRAGELSIPGINYCKLAPGHAPPFHSTKSHQHDHMGFDWWMPGYNDKPRPDFRRQIEFRQNY